MKLDEIETGVEYAIGSHRSSVLNARKATVVGIHLGGKLPEGFTVPSYSGYSRFDNSSKKLVLIEWADRGDKYRKDTCSAQEVLKKWEEYQKDIEADERRRDEEHKKWEACREDERGRWARIANKLEAVGNASISSLVEYGGGRITLTIDEVEGLLGVKKS